MSIQSVLPNKTTQVISIKIFYVTFLKVKWFNWAVVVHAFNPSTQKAEAGRSEFLDQPAILSKIQDSQGNM